MQPSQITPFVRYALFALGMKMTEGDFLPPGIFEMIANDPEAVQALAGLGISIGTLAWYLFSTSRRALIEKLNW